MNAELVQIGGNKSKVDNTSNKKSLLKRIKNRFSEEWETVGGLSTPSKMPGYGYSTPANACITGAKLREVEGSACYSCYAVRGNYTYPTIQRALNNRLELLTHPLWVPSMVTLINAACSELAEPYFRWHDSGDIQGIWHLNLIIQVCELTPNIKHWLPTREYAMLKGLTPSNHPQYILPENTYKSIPKNLVVRLSAHMIDGIPPSHHWNTSTITTDNKPVTLNSTLCQAYTRQGFCGDCRKCWDKNVPDVTYPKH